MKRACLLVVALTLGATLPRAAAPAITMDDPDGEELRCGDHAGAAGAAREPFAYLAEISMTATV
jgi:hypothetical protein